jgi:peptide chain release factor 1
LLDKLDEIVARHQAINDQLMRPDISSKDMIELNKERVQIDPIVEKYQVLQSNLTELEENKVLLEDDDNDIQAMAKEEIPRLAKENSEIEKELQVLLLPKDPNDEKNIIIEIRAGTGGDEAALFAGELFQMYSRYAIKKGWKVDVMTLAGGTKGGTKEAIASINGSQVYSHLKFEAGVHRVQRVPETETQGRVHTSACTVAVMAEAEDVDIQIADKDVRIDVFRASGPGGQSVNTTDSAVRLTHLPTGLVVQCQDEKSQLKNKNKAMKVLRARLYDKMQGEVDAERAEERRSMVKSGDRSEKIRTYNFPQDRCTDHRVSLTVHNLPKLFSGELDDLIDAIRAHFQAEQLKGMNL